MKDLLNYYYYLIVDRINMRGNNYYFLYQNNYFCLYRIFDLSNTQELFNLNNYMLLNNYKINRIILNKDGQIITKRGNYFYVLVLLTYNTKKIIDLNNIITFNQRLVDFNTYLNRTNWLSLWSTKIDNIEYSIHHLMHQYKLLYNSIHYYIGLTENAISYLKMINFPNNNISICHKRVLANDTIQDFYNPLNLIIDYRIRDLAEYFKSCFFIGKMDVLDIINSLKKIKMANSDYVYFYIRMLFPSYYFDLYDLILLGKVKEEKILTITKYQNDYEYLLYEIYLVIKSHINIIGIEWINKKFAI